MHVHSDHPDQVLKYFLDHGQISEVFIHNMQIQSAERTGRSWPPRSRPSASPWAFVAGRRFRPGGDLLKSLESMSSSPEARP